MKNNKLYLITFLTFSLFLSLNVQAENQEKTSADAMVVGDFDNDGVLNNVLLINDRKISLANSYYNNIDFSNIEFPLPSDLTDIASLNGKVVTGDFDHDGFIDDVAAIYSIGYDKTSFTVWINNDGKFTPSQWWYGPDFDANQTSFTLVSGDFDNDGFVDDVAGFYNYDQLKTKVYVWKSTGSKFEWPGTWWIGSDFNATCLQSSIVVGDFDHDGFTDDIAGLYNYSSGKCKIFVWTSQKNSFAWPYTWYTKENFNAQNLKGSIVSGDFDQNGYIDNIAALYRNDEESTEILVWGRSPNGFNEPSTWWYGDKEGSTTQNRLVSLDVNNNNINDQITGLAIDETQSEWLTWTAMNNSFSLPESQSIDNNLLGIEDCNKNGGCILNNTSSIFEMYPNPAKSYCQIALPKDNGIIHVQVINMLGCVVYQTSSQPETSVNLNLDEIKSGTYIVKLSGSLSELKQNLVIE